MKIERKKYRGAEVYTASLNDILFFLMLFFLIISTMVTPMVIRVAMPQSSTSKQVATKQNINLTVTHDMTYFLDDRQVQFEEIEPILASRIQGLPEDQKPMVMLQADRNNSVQSLVDIIDICNRLNIKMTVLAPPKN